MTRRGKVARWGRRTLQPVHPAWGYTARALVAIIAIRFWLDDDGIPRGSTLMPLSAWLAVPPLVLLGSLGVTRLGGKGTRQETSWDIVYVIMFLTIPPLPALLVVAVTGLLIEALTKRPFVEKAFNLTSDLLLAAVVAAVLHLPFTDGILGLTGILQVWAALIAFEVIEHRHTTRFRNHDAEDPSARLPGFFGSRRVEALGRHLIFSAFVVVAFRAVRADHDLWYAVPLLLLTAVLFSLLIMARNQHRNELAAEREWLLTVRAPMSTDNLPALAETIQVMARAAGVRLVVNGVSMDIGAIDAGQVGQAASDVSNPLCSRTVGVARSRDLRRFFGGYPTVTYAAVAGGRPGDQVAISTTWWTPSFLESSTVGIVEHVSQEISLALERDRQRLGLERVATHDTLTGLMRPSAFIAAFTERLSSWGGATVVLIQVGKLRQFNDLYGRGAGDELLSSMARRLSDALTETALTCRLGGHLFAAAFEGGEIDRAHAVAALLCRALDRSGDAGGGDVTLTLGAAVSPQDGTDVTALLRRAELGLDVAYHQGETVGFFSPDVETESLRKQQLVTSLGNALEQGLVTAAYQPQVSPHNDRIVGVEALARWIDPELGFIPPDEFIAIAESSGLIRRLTQVILETSLQQCRAWADEGLDIPMSVNLSARSLCDPTTVPLVAQLLLSTGVPARKLTLEVTETAVMDDPAVAIETLQALRALGAKISLDDFGTGHSSLAYLRTLPADEIKLDRAFTSDLIDPAALALVKASVELAHALGLTIVAEGVEDQLSLNLLRGLGVDIAQGYHLCRPGTPEAIRPFLLSRQEQPHLCDRLAG